jgi:hypothetical protein
MKTRTVGSELERFRHLLKQTNLDLAQVNDDPPSSEEVDMAIQDLELIEKQIREAKDCLTLVYKAYKKEGI